MAVTIQTLIPRLAPGLSFEVREFRGKADLMRRLPSRLKGYAQWAQDASAGVLVVVDRDNDDCHELRSAIIRHARDQKFSITSVSSGAQGNFAVSLAIEELEAWFFGDMDALRKVYPRLPMGLESRARLRDPDAITGGTWEALQDVLQRAGYHRGGLPKVTAATSIASYLDPERNRSRSFDHFRDTVILMTREAC